MKEATIPIHCSEVIKIHQDAMTFPISLKENLKSDKIGYLMENLGSKAIPESQLLLKDHKKKKNSNYPTRLMIPPTNFAATFSKIGYLAIKKIFDKEGVNYNKYTKQHASDPKEKLEMLNLK
eukprot:14549652-Ditylum_brightwellii.AAC.1